MNQYNYDQQDDYQSAPKRSGLASRNASSFDIIGFNPQTQHNSKDQERLDKKQKQAAYRDQLDSMATGKPEQKKSQRVVTQESNQINYGEQAYLRERREQDDRKANEESHAQDQKKRMLQEINEANKRAAQSKMNDKRRQKADELAEDNQRAQDSLSQFERDGFRKHEAKKYANEENTRALGQQLREKGQPSYTPSYDSVDKLHYGQNDRDSRNPLAPSYSNINQNQPQSLDNLSAKMGKLATSCPFATDDNHNAQQQHTYGRKRVEEPSSRNNFDNGPGYQRNKGRAQQGGYNIINHEN